VRFVLETARGVQSMVSFGDVSWLMSPVSPERGQLVQAGLDLRMSGDR
jgi:hypothetical protein